MRASRMHVGFHVDRGEPSPDWRSIAGWINQHSDRPPAVVRDAADIVGINVPAYLSLDIASRDFRHAVQEARAAVEEAVHQLGVKDFSWQGITAIPILISGN